MKTWHKFGIAVMLLSVTACNSKTSRESTTDMAVDSSVDNSVKLISVDIDSSEKLKDFVSSTDSEILMLKDEDVDVFPGIISNAEIVGDTLYVLDSYKSPGFYAYDIKNGSQIFAYTEFGDGPKGFLTVSDLSVGDDCVRGYDRIVKQLITINKDGSFRSSEKFDEDIVEAIYDDAHCLWADYSNNASMTTKLACRLNGKEEWKSVYDIPEHLKGIYSIPLRSFHKLYDGSVSYVPWLENAVFELRNGVMSQKYKIDLHGLIPDNDEMKKIAESGNWVQHMRRLPLQRMLYMESEHWVVLFLSCSGGKSYIHLYDKATEKNLTLFDSEDKYLFPIAINGNDLFLETTEDSKLEIVSLKPL